MNLFTGINLVLSIVLPVLTGYILFNTGDYRILFALAFIISILSIFIPFKYNKKGKSRITSTEITKILKHVEFPKFAFIRMVDAGSKSLDNIIMFIVPFLILGNEFDVGILYSAIGVLAAMIAFGQRKTSDNNRIKLGFIGIFIHNVVTIAFSLFWNGLFLAIRSMANVFSKSTFYVTTSAMDLELREHILDDEVDASSPEMNLITEALYLMGRLVFYGAAIIFLISISEIKDSENILRVILLIVSLVFSVIYFIYQKRYKKIIT